MNRQWTKGQSGNPNGSTRQESLQALASLARALKSKVTVSVDGKPTKLSVMDVLMRQLVADAAKGNATARRELFKMMQFAEATDNQWTVIDARPVFQEEENRLKDLVAENEQLRAQIESLNAKAR
jgi:hypothetical protein